MRAPARTLFLLTLVAAAMTACAGPGERDSPARAPGIPSRIVSLAPALTEILFALDLGDRVVGVTRFCDFPPEAKLLPKVGGYVNPSVEGVLRLEPDLVLVSPAGGNRDAALSLRRAGLTLEVIPAETLEEALSAMEEVARVCGVPERGRALARSVRERIESAAARVRAMPKVRVLFCVQLAPLIVAGRGTLPSQLVELAGGVNVVDAERYPRVGIESVLDAAPEVILLSRMDAVDARADAEQIEFWNRWPAIPAVKNGRVYLLDADAILRPGPRIGAAIEGLVDLLHPKDAPA